METTPKHRADRPESAPITASSSGVLLRFNPYAKCTGSAGGHHVKPCPQHHPGSYARMAPRRWKHRGRQAVPA